MILVIKNVIAFCNQGKPWTCVQSVQLTGSICSTLLATKTYPGKLMLSSISITVQSCAKDLYETNNK